MHFNNYFVEHIRGDMRWGGGHHVNIEQKRGVTCYLHGLKGGGGLTEILIFPTYFSVPSPLYINNDRTLRGDVFAD